MRQFIPLAAALLCGALASDAQAKDPHKSRRLSFEHGRAVVKGVIRGYETHDYVFPPARANRYASASTAAKPILM